MNYDAQELTNTIRDLESKLNNISIADLQQMTNIPQLDQYSQQLTGLLPENFINTGPAGLQSLLSPTNLANKLAQGVGQILPEIQNQATGLLNGIAGKVLGSFNSFNGEAQSADISSLLSQMSDAISTKSSEQMVGALQNLTQSLQIGNLQSAIDSGVNAVSNLSPKGIRDLANPSTFNNKVITAVNNAKSNVTAAAQQMAEEQIGNPIFNNSGQQAFQQLSSPLFSGDNANGYRMAVRITAYWSKGAGTDFYTAKKMSSTGRILAEGYSAAVDPALIPYLSRMEIPYAGTRFAVDTGGAVKARKASGGRRPIVDIYFETRQSAKAFLASLKSEEVIITVYPPKSVYKYVRNAPPLYGTA